MNITTEPIRDPKKLQDLLAYLKGKNERNYIMAKIQLNTALRIGDVVPLKVSDFLHESGNFREYITLNEEKTNKNKHIAINKALKTTLKAYIHKYDLDYNDYLLFSRKGGHISTTQAHRIYSDAGSALYIENFNSHALRKTWGYNAYKKTHNLALIMQIYNHSSINHTMRYIGITQKEKDTLYNQIQF